MDKKKDKKGNVIIKVEKGKNIWLSFDFYIIELDCTEFFNVWYELFNI